MYGIIHGLHAQRDSGAGRLVLVLLAAVVLLAVSAGALYAWQALAPRASGIPEPDYWPTAGWRTSPPEAQGWDSQKMADGLLAVQKDGTRIHSLMLARNGYVFLDAYFAPYDGSMYHDLASVTKSVMTTLIAIAADQGKLKLDEPILSYFPDRTIANRDARKEQITVRHLAGMTSGLECDSLSDSANVMPMQASADWVQHALDRKVVREPGSAFAYCSPDTHLLSAILQETTGMSALEFARANLFEPLGIKDVYWASDPQGYTRGWGDLALYPRDAAKIGFLFLHGGRWEGRQIVSAEWVAQATRVQAATEPQRGEDYGYGWWVTRADADIPYFAADGRMGQRVVLVPVLNIMIVSTGAGFEMSDVLDAHLVPAMLDTEHALPANPAGVERLAAAVASLAQPPAAQAVPPLPAAARAISGRVCSIEATEIGKPWLRLDFDAPDEATFTMDFANGEGVRLSGVGLDGVYRASREGRPVLARGRWVDEQTFEIDYSQGPGLNDMTIRLSFDGDHITFELQEVPFGVQVSAEGTCARP